MTWKQVRLLVAVASAAQVKGKAEAPTTELLDAALSNRDARGAHLAYTEMQKADPEAKSTPETRNSLMQCEYLHHSLHTKTSIN